MIGLLISPGYVGQLIGALVGGWLAERFGRRPVIVSSIPWFGLLSLACAYAWSYQSLMILRALQRLGLGTVFLTFGFTVLTAATVIAVSAVETKGRVLEEISP